MKSGNVIADLVRVRGLQVGDRAHRRDFAESGAVPVPHQGPSGPDVLASRDLQDDGRDDYG